MDSKSWNLRHQQQLSFGHVVATASTSTAVASVTNHWQRINCDNATNENTLFQNHYFPQQNQMQQLKYFHVQKQPSTQYTAQMPGSLQQQQLQCYLPQYYSLTRQDAVYTDKMHNRFDKPGIIPYLQMNSPCTNSNVSLINDNFTLLNADISYQQQFLTEQYPDVNFRQYQVNHQQQILRAANDLPVPLTEVSLTTCFALRTSYEGQVYVASFVDPMIVSYNALPPFSISCKEQFYINVIEAVPDMLKDIRPILADTENFLNCPLLLDQNQQTYYSHHQDRLSNLFHTNKQRLRNLNWARFIRKNRQLIVPEFYHRPSFNSANTDVVNYKDYRNETFQPAFPDRRPNFSDMQKSYADVLQENDYKQDVSFATTHKTTESPRGISFANCKTATNILERNEKLFKGKINTKCNLGHANEGVSFECPSKQFYKMAEAFCLEQLENLAFFRAFEPYDRSKKRLPYTEMFFYRSHNKTQKSTNCGEVTLTTFINVGGKQVYLSSAENRGNFKFFQKLRKKCSTIGSMREITAWKTNYHDYSRRNY